jgi:hypothetical protein
MGEYGHVRYHVQDGMRLISKEGGVVLWADNISSDRFAHSASSSFAENVAKSLARLLPAGAASHNGRQPVMTNSQWQLISRYSRSSKQAP